MKQEDGWRVWAVCLVLGLGVIGLYAPAFTYGFVNYEDPLYVVSNPHVNKGLAAAFGWAFKTGYGHAWQPLTWLSHALDCSIYGLKSAGHHATNLLLHALNSALVFLVLRQLTGAFWRSAAVAAFFAWHPLHVESAAWVAERSGLLCAFFWLLSLWAYIRYAQHFTSRSPRYKWFYAGALALFALALMAGPLATTLPLIFLLLDWWPLGRLAAGAERPAGKPAMSLLVEKIPFFVLAAAACVMNAIVIHSSQMLDPIARLPFRLRFVSAGLSCFHYVWKSIWPVDLGAWYPFVFGVPKWELIGAALVLVGISAVVVWARKTQPFGLVGWLWFLAALFPVLDLVQTGAQPFSDRYMYLPSIGLWMAICWEAYELAAARNRQLALGGLCALLLAACGALSWMQLGTWKDEESLLARIPDTNSNAFGHSEYAAYLLQHGQPSQAQIECEKALSIKPNNPRFLILLGDIFLAEQKTGDAVQKFQSALIQDPKMELARQELGRAFLVQKRLDDAAHEFKTVIHDEPKDYEAHNLLANAYILEGKPALVAEEYHASLKLQTNQPSTLNNLAWLLATDPDPEIRHGAQAVDLAKRACFLTRGAEPSFIGTLAAAFAEAGDFDKAVEAGKMARDLALSQGRKALADTNAMLLQLYAAHKPFHSRQ